MAVPFASWWVPEPVYSVVVGAADEYHVPRELLLAIAGCESTFNPGARGDKNLCRGDQCDYRDPDGYCSFGLCQFNRCGGAGQDHKVADLLDMVYNARLGAWTMRTRYDATGSWYAAIQPWSTRDAAWAIYQATEGTAATPPTAGTPPPGSGNGNGGGDGGGGEQPRPALPPAGTGWLDRNWGWVALAALAVGVAAVTGEPRSNQEW
ncbi:MAG: transglycosylase SLT domain-containing protein [Chloroflexi bacterium]|nr:transglycosylase SLT domain-containing protein [Chloroflexota bacterium]